MNSLIYAEINISWSSNFILEITAPSLDLMVELDFTVGWFAGFGSGFFGKTPPILFLMMACRLLVYYKLMKGEQKQSYF